MHGTTSRNRIARMFLVARWIARLLGGLGFASMIVAVALAMYVKESVLFNQSFLLFSFFSPFHT